MSFELFANVIVYLKDEVDTLLAGKSDSAHTHASSIPAGLIAMWSGTLANVPTGWALCDGSNGTPDLRDKFIKGWAAGVNPGGTGGSLTHSHAGHSDHSVTQPDAHGTHTHTGPSHTHPQNTGGTANITAANAVGASSEEGATMYSGGTSGALKRMQSGVSAAGTGATGNENAALSHSGAAVDAHSAHDSPNHEPPYYKLAFIVKT